LKKLAVEKISSVLVEGGQQIFSQFLQNDLADELKVFIAPQIWGSGVPAIIGDPLYKIRPWHLHTQKDIMGDILLIYRR
jgi:riboflavin biosynthesis pyrimidine reductase